MPSSVPTAHFDTVIIGAGTAGCLLANRLSADPHQRVLLVEAGGPDTYHWIHVPVGYLYCIGNPRTDWLYHTEPDPGLNGRTLRYPRGKTLGGSSSINGMIYMRGQARDYDAWAHITGDAAWSWEQCLPYFQLHEDYHRGFDALHGSRHAVPQLLQSDDPHFGRLRAADAGGEWRVEAQRLRWPVLEAFREAAQQAGLPPCPDFNRGNNEGVGYFEVNQRAGWRWNAAKAFLRPGTVRRSNFALWTHTQAAQLLVQAADADGPARCTGVRLCRNGGLVDVSAERIVLSAGSIGSAQLLQLSGIGPAAWLQPHGIAPLVDLPGVGANLQDHLQIRSVYRVRGARTLNSRAASWHGKAGIGLEYLLRRSGPMSMAPSQLGAFARSSSQYEWPNLEYHVQPLSLDAFGEPLHRFDAFTASVCNLNPTSRGTVRIKSPRFTDAPAIAPGYLATEADRQVAADSLRLTRRIVAQPALQPFAPEEVKPGMQWQSDEDLTRLAGDIASTIFHPVGTTRMGPDGDAMAVLTPRLQVRDGRGGTVRGLYVADAGAMPIITSGNTNSPTLMLAEKAAHWLANAADGPNG